MNTEYWERLEEIKAVWRQYLEGKGDCLEIVEIEWLIKVAEEAGRQ